jgi:hypothetical protein
VVPGDTDKLLLFFQGGGACWDRASTDAKSCTSDAKPQDLVGLFDRANAENPYRVSDSTLLEGWGHFNCVLVLWRAF